MFDTCFPNLTAELQEIARGEWLRQKGLPWRCQPSEGSYVVLSREVSEPLLIVLEKLWHFSEVLSDWKRGNVTLFLKNLENDNPGDYRSVILTLCPARSWSRSSCRVITHMEKRMASLRANCA